MGDETKTEIETKTETAPAPVAAPSNFVEKITAFLKSPKLHAALPLLVAGMYAVEQKVPNIEDAIAMVVLWCTRIGSLAGAVAGIAGALKKKPAA